MAMSSRPLLRSRYIVTQLPGQCVTWRPFLSLSRIARPARRLFRAHVAWMPRPCRVDVRRASVGFRPDAVKPGFHGPSALDPGFHGVPTGPEHSDRAAGGASVT